MAEGTALDADVRWTRESMCCYTWRPRWWLTVTVQTTGPGLADCPPRWFWSASPCGMSRDTYATHTEAQAAAVASVRAEIAATHATLPPAGAR